MPDAVEGQYENMNVIAEVAGRNTQGPESPETGFLSEQQPGMGRVLPGCQLVPEKSHDSTRKMAGVSVKRGTAFRQVNRGRVEAGSFP
jgi:hypothetical protein